MRLMFSIVHYKWHRKYGFRRCCMCARRHYGIKRIIHERKI